MNFFQKLFDRKEKSFTEDTTVNASNFYQLMNTNYNVRELSRNDYIRLYTGWAYVSVSMIADSMADLQFTLTTRKD